MAFHGNLVSFIQLKFIDRLLVHIEPWKEYWLKRVEIQMPLDYLEFYLAEVVDPNLNRERLIDP